MIKTQLFEFKAQDFKGMKNLEQLNFEKKNKLNSIPLDSFITSNNEIKTYKLGLFKNNQKKIFLFKFMTQRQN